MFGYILALNAGLCAALASVCAKLAMASEESLRICLEFVSLFVFDNNSKHYCEPVVILIRVLFFGLIFIFNAIMWTLFVKALNKCSSSLEATIFNTAANFFFTAIFGNLLFGEVLSLRWWLGASIILTGLLFISKANPESISKKEK